MADILKQFGNAARAQAAIKQADATARAMAEHCDERIAKKNDALRAAQEKLKLYRGAHSGEYLGGTEFSRLMQIIDDAIAA